MITGRQVFFNYFLKNLCEIHEFLAKTRVFASDFSPQSKILID